MIKKSNWCLKAGMKINKEWMTFGRDGQEHALLNGDAVKLVPVQNLRFLETFHRKQFLGYFMLCQKNLRKK